MWKGVRCREAGTGARAEGTSSRHWGKGTPRTGGSTRDKVGHRAPTQQSPHDPREPRGRQSDATRPAGQSWARLGRGAQMWWFAHTGFA